MSARQLPTDAKIVAVLLTDVVSSTQHLTQLGDEAGNAQRARHFALLRANLEQHDGVEVKNTGDGILAVFPSAVDAVRCAAAMQRSVERDRVEHPADGVQMKVGLHVGEPVHEESDFFGEAMVVVTRLCDAASPGQILASALLRALVAPRHDLRFDAVGALELKGLPTPVEAFSVLWAPAEASTAYVDELATDSSGSDFVDRVGERAMLAEWYATAARSRRTFGLVSGEMGIGKTRLVAEAAHAAHEAGAVVLWGRSFEDSLAPYGAFAEALRRLASWLATTGELPEVAAAAQHLAALSPAFGPVLDAPSAALSVGGASRDGVAVRPPQAAQRDGHDLGADRLRLFDAVDRVLHELAGAAPVVLVLDDLHWADDATLLLLSHLVRSPDPDRLLILATCRDGDPEQSRALKATLADLRREHRIERLRLGGLGEHAAAELVRGLVDVELPPTVVRRVLEQAEGNPFFVEEVVTHLVETGVIDALASDGDAVDLNRIELPDGISEVVGRRLARLGDEVGAVLSVAAVVGREFDLLVVEKVCRLGRDAVVDALDEAIHAGLVAEDPDTVGRFHFTHALVRRTLTEDLSAARRAHLHERIADAMEPDTADPRIAAGAPDRQRLTELAHHALAAVPLGDPWRAVRHARRAGERALADLAYEQAADLFGAATTVADGTVPPDRQALELRAQVVLGSGEASVLAGDLEAARAAFRRTIEDAAQLDDGALRARATLGFGAALGSGTGFEFGVPSDELVQLLRDALAGSPAGDSATRAMLTARLGAALGSSPDPSDAVATAREALAMAERLGSPSTIAFSLNALRAAGWGRIDRDEQRGLAGRIVDAAAAADEPLLELQGRVWQIADALEAGDADAADAAHAALERLVDRVRLPQYRWYLELYGATRSLLDGDLDAAEARSLAALELGSSMGDPNIELAFGGQSYQQWVERGWLPELLPIAQEQSERFPTMTAWRAGLAQALAAAGRLGEAARLMVDTLAQVRVAPAEPLRPLTLSILADVAARVGDRAAAAELYELMVPFDGRLATVAQVAGVAGAMAHHLGVAAAAAGRWDVALAHFDAGAAQHRRLRAPTWEARSLVAAAEVHLEAADAGEDRADRAASEVLDRAEATIVGLDLPELRGRLAAARARLAAVSAEARPVLAGVN